MFFDREEAGTLLAQKLLPIRGDIDRIVGLSHGGVVISLKLSHILHLPFDVLVVKKIGAPGNPELAVGARVPEGQRVDVRDKRVLIVDDGAATGETMKAAISWVKKHRAQTVMVGLPVATKDVVLDLGNIARRVIVVDTPTDFGAVGQFYTNFPQLTDEDVLALKKGGTS